MRGILEYDPRVEPIVRCSPEEREAWELEDAQRRARHPQKQEPLSAAEKELVKAYVEAVCGKKF